MLLRAGHAWAEGIVHVPFGVVLIGGTRAKTRTGQVVLLLDVLDEAVEKVTGLIREKNPALPDLERVARDVGIGAVVFNDLKNRRMNDVDLNLDAILKFEGKTGPYVMYSHARACSILRKHGGPIPPAPADLGRPALRPVGVRARAPRRALPRARRAGRRERRALRGRHAPPRPLRGVPRLPREGKPGHGTARALEDPLLRASRLALVEAVRRTLANGLALLGVAAPVEM